MTSNLKIELYITLIVRIRRGLSVCGKNNAKPLLLLTVVLLIIDSKLNKNIIKIDGLINLYNKMFDELNIPKTNIAYPFFYLKNDNFWHLKWKNDEEIFIKTPSNKFLRENVEYAYLDDDLWELLQDESARKRIKGVLLELIKNN